MTGAGAEPPKTNRWETLNQYRGLFAFVFVFILGCIFTPRVGGTGPPIFLSFRTQLDILYEYCEYGLLATGMTLVILAGGIDLSVGSVLGCSATLFALLTIGYGWSIGAALGMVVLFGLAAGALNGMLIARFNMQPFVVTLATMTGARGLAKWISGGIKVQPAAQPWYALKEDTPSFFRWMSQGLPGIGVKPAVLLFLFSLFIMAIIVSRTAYGRKLYAIGGNEVAARLGGIAVDRIKIITYALCGLFAALAGVVNATRQDIGDPEAGATFELYAIAAVVIGGTSLAGGAGGMGFTFIGVLIIAYINKILSLNAVPEAQRLIIQAGIILAAVLIQRRKRR
ncbi:MAG TPA: ABC transporter permease [Chthonomonadaceae bacterium]|nr:ABC transporter permease [Chthonomonadaceae bacterium]